MFIVAHNGAREWGGAERATALLLAGLQERGHRVLLLCNDPTVAEHSTALGVPTELAPLGGDLAIPDALRMATRLRRLRPDVLLLGTFRKIWLGGLAGRLARVPRIVVRIGLETDVPRNLKYRFVLSRFVDLVVLKTQDVRERYLERMPTLDPARLLTIEGGVTPRPVSRGREAVRADLDIPLDVLVVGSVGRLAPQKRFDRLVAEFAALPPPARLVIVGEGSERPEIEAAARRLGVADRVILTGYREDVGDLLSALDIYVVSSDREGTSNAMVEAMAAGLPVISTPVSGAREALEPAEDDPAGQLTDFQPGSIAAALRALATDPDRRARLGRAAAHRAATRYSFAQTVDRWERALGTEAIGT